MRFTPSRILIFAAIVLFLLAAFTIDVGDDVNLLALGLACFAASFLVR
jgi:hypothetical protein